eukprot:g37180.t1
MSFMTLGWTMLAVLMCFYLHVHVPDRNAQHSPNFGSVNGRVLIFKSLTAEDLIEVILINSKWAAEIGVSADPALSAVSE